MFGSSLDSELQYEWSIDWGLISNVNLRKTCLFPQYIQAAISLLQGSMESTGEKRKRSKDICFGEVFSLAVKSSNLILRPSKSADRDMCRQAIVSQLCRQAIVKTSYRDLMYIIEGVDFSMSPSDTFEVDIAGENGKRKRVTMSFAAYLMHRHGVDVHESGPPMLSARLVGGVFEDLLHPRELKEESGKLNLIPSTCIVEAIPLEVIKLAELIPSIMHRVEQFCLIEEFRLVLGLESLTNSTLFEAFSATVNISLIFF
jgi:hypothetical protein